MSILIPDMKMPKSCPCELVGIGYDRYCSFTFGIPARVKQYGECCESRTKPNWCPLIEAPSTDVRPVVRGKWLPDYDYMEYDFDGSTPLPEPLKFQDGWQCSLCGEYTPSETNYCPNCGADMREANDGI